jgi:CRP-like cAMP-binding protein
VFTEQGALMAATILNSPCAVEVSIYVVRAFVRLRELASTHGDLAKRLGELEDKTEALAMNQDTFSRITRNQLKQVFDALRELMTRLSRPSGRSGSSRPRTRARRLRGPKERLERGALQAKGKTWYRSQGARAHRRARHARVHPSHRAVAPDRLAGVWLPSFVTGARAELPCLSCRVRLQGRKESLLSTHSTEARTGDHVAAQVPTLADSETPCDDCPLRPLALFVDQTTEEFELVRSLKRRELRLGAVETVIHEGQTDAPLYTLLHGWAFRYKTLSDGRRQILSFLLAGDFIGVQQKMGDAAAHGVETLTDAVFCVFQRDALWELHRRSPTMGFNVTWLTAQEESLVDGNLLSVGRRNAEERIASLLILLFKRAAALQGDRGASGVPFPLTQQHVADGLGLSLVHTNKTLRKLEKRGLHRIRDGRLFLQDAKALVRLADLYGDGRPPLRPLV